MLSKPGVSAQNLHGTRNLEPGVHDSPQIVEMDQRLHNCARRAF